MRMPVFFDLPTETDADRREYRRFRKMLIKNGFLMLQESVYCKLFVIVGLRGLFGDEEVARFLKTVLDHGYRVLLMDTVARERLPNEKRLTIDNDLCEF